MTSRKVRKRRRRRAVATAAQETGSGDGVESRGGALESADDVRIVSKLIGHDAWVIPKHAFTDVPNQMVDITECHPSAKTRVAAAAALARMHGQNTQQARASMNVAVVQQPQRPEPVDEPEADASENFLANIAYLEQPGQSALYETAKVLTDLNILANMAAQTSSNGGHYEDDDERAQIATSHIAEETR